MLFDIARALCVLEIVGFWHMIDYINCYDPTIRLVGWGLTGAVLSCFTFISGFFLGKKQVIDVKSFYVLRLKRFFVPLFITTLFFVAMGQIMSVKQFIFTLTGLTCFFPNLQPMTIWYFSMIIVLYLITPFLLGESKNKFLLKSFSIFLFFLLLYHVQHLDHRILLYYPFYVVGILSSQESVVKVVQNNVIGCMVFVLWIVICFCVKDKSLMEYMVMNVFGVYLILFISQKVEHNIPKLNNIFSYLSYASMFAYLFHREVYMVFQILFKKLLNFEAIPIIVVPIMIIILFIASYYGQKTYDKLFIRKH